MNKDQSLYDQQLNSSVKTIQKIFKHIVKDTIHESDRGIQYIPDLDTYIVYAFTKSLNQSSGNPVNVSNPQNLLFGEPLRVLRSRIESPL